MSSKKIDVRKRQRSSNKNWLVKYVPRSRAIHTGAPGLGRSLKTKLKTTFYSNVTAAGTGIFTGFLNPGSCFDPCGDLAAIQPVTYDQLSALYARYLVTGATVKITVAPQIENQAGLDYAFVMAAYPSTVSTVPSTFQGAASQPYAQQKLHAVGSGAVHMKFKLDTQKIIGSRLPPVAEDCGALVGADPTNGQFIRLPIFLQNATANAVSWTVLVEIVQDVIFDQRIQVVDA